jgi:hypothetical protein
MKPRFTTRDLLWLTVVAALAVVWWLDHRHLVEQNPGFTFSGAVYPW